MVRDDLPGSGNAIAKSMDCEDPMAATFALIRGKAAPWDIMGIKQGDSILYSHLSLTHGMIADIDIGYEDFRCVPRATPRGVSDSVFASARPGAQGACRTRARFAGLCAATGGR